MCIYTTRKGTPKICIFLIDEKNIKPTSRAATRLFEVVIIIILFYFTKGLETLLLYLYYKMKYFMRNAFVINHLFLCGVFVCWNKANLSYFDSFVRLIFSDSQ